MTTGIILILATLVLGGVIASVGDRIGTKVGKARLSLFNLRPKKTAVLVTLLTGSLISGSTLAVLFAASEQLRTGVFQLEKIQKNLRNARKEIEKTRIQKSQVENQLAQAKSDQAVAQQRLDVTNQSLQTALSKLSEAVAKQSRTEAQLGQTQNQLGQTQTALNQVQGQLGQTQGQLNQTQSQLKDVSQQATTLRSEITKLQTERQQLIAQREQVKAQLNSEIQRFTREREQLIAQREQVKARLNSEIQRFRTEREQLIAQRDQVKNQLESEIDKFEAERQQLLEQQERVRAQLNQLKDQLAQRDQEISERDQVIAQRTSSLKQLETQQKELEDKQLYLQQAVQVLEEYYQDYQALRGGNLVVFRNQVLASGVVRIVEPAAARQAVDQLLVTANRVAIESTRPGDRTFNQQVIKITQTEVDRLVDRIDDGQDYVVRILAAGNYIRGESSVNVFADVSPNRVIFQAGEVVATTSADPATMTQQQLLQRIDQLIAASQFRARSAGVVADKIQIGDDRIETLMGFIQKLKQSQAPLDVQVVVTDVTYTAGPVKIDLVAVQNGQVLFRT